MKNRKSVFTAVLCLFLALALFASCKKQNTDGQNTELALPEDENRQEEIAVNDDYANSEVIDFFGTIEEIYEDGSMLVYSPFFMNYNYHAIVETDGSTQTPDFTPREGQYIRFYVYSSVKKTEPLTIVASELSLQSETSTQKQDEEARLERARSAAKEAGLPLNE